MGCDMLTLDEIAAELGARRVGANVEFSGVATDSRKIARGDLFVALKGANFDGAEFVSGAGQAGAAAAIVEKEVESAIPLLVVKDARIALGKLAGFWRGRFGIPVIAVTGSNGKTTVKEMLAAILREKGEVLATRGNLNNDIGLPLTLLGLRREHRFAVIEMGMNHAGEIGYLCSIAKPDFALVTNAASAHLEGLGSVAAVARAKGEIFEGLKQDGTAIINADDAYAPLWRNLAGARGIVCFGLSGKADVTARYVLDEYGSDVVLHVPEGEVRTRLQVPGLHNVRNALAAAAAASAAGIDANAIGQGLAKFAGVAGRMQRKAGRKGAILVDDTYNANPDSVRAAIAWLSNAKGKTMLILGDMGELGPDSSRLHGEIGVAARDAGIGALLALGKASEAAAASFGEGANHFQDVDALAARAKSLLEPGMTVLVKGSRFMKMERVVEQLEEKEKACC